MWFLGTAKRASGDAGAVEDDIAPHMSWRDAHRSLEESMRFPARARMARDKPGLFLLTSLFKNASLEDVATRLAQVRGILKEGGEWEQGSGGSSAAGVYSMTPQSLGVPGSGLGGQGAFNSIASMQMRPTLASGMYGGWGGPGGGDVGGVINSYRTMAGGGPVGW